MNETDGGYAEELIEYINTTGFAQTNWLTFYDLFNKAIKQNNPSVKLTYSNFTNILMTNNEYKVKFMNLIKQIRGVK